MFYLIETNTQFNILQNKIAKSCYIDYIYGNDNTHPALAEIIAIYISNLDEDKGYILPINHSECINLSKDEIFDYIKTLEKIYVLDKKAALHANPLKSYTDIQYKYYFDKNEPFPDEFNTQAHTYFYRKYPQTKVNKMIPIGKHYERCQEKKRALTPWFQVHVGTHYDEKIIPSLYLLERNSLKFNNKFDEHFELKCKKHSVKDNNIYGWYNPYTTTGRPVNNFNGINFVGLKHGTGERDCFVPKNDYFIEMDYDSFHPHLIANMIGYNFKDYPYHELAKLYFNTDSPTPSQYKESKILTFKQIYGGVHRKYLHHPFFKGIQKYTNDKWDEFQERGYTMNHCWKKIKKENHKEMTKAKLFNYLIQSKETDQNMYTLSVIHTALKKFKTKIVLYNYDAFVFDFCDAEYNSLFKTLEYIVSGEYPISIKKGYHYGALHKI
jgi:hypothetical protein